jgi:two-component system phosphate regulon sensor histidine kinase PhoR
VFDQLNGRSALANVLLIVVAAVSLDVYLVASSQMVIDRAVPILIWAVLTSAGALLLTARLSSQTTNQLDRLTRMARRLAAGDAVEPIVVDPTDEVATLVESLNDMAVSLQRKIEGIEQQRVEAAAILDGMGDGVVIVDEELRVVSINRAAERILEVGDAIARGASVVEVVRHHDVVGLLDLGKHAEGPLVVEIGRDRHQVQVVVTPVRIGDRIRQIILLQDVTELRRAETIRRDFVANVSHELRTPLAALRLLVETLEDGALDDPPAAKEFLGRMHGEVDRLNQMVEELLELARIESGRVQYRFRKSDLSLVVGEAVERMRPQAERQGIDLVLDAPAEPVETVIDPDRLHQVIVNLVHNAVKFTPSGGSIRVTVRRSDPRREITIADTGVGVSAEALSRLFERFYKVDRSRSSPGTGLGLAIVKHLVLAHGGQVWAESPGPGQGTTFHIELSAGLGTRPRESQLGYRVTASLHPEAFDERKHGSEG